MPFRANLSRSTWRLRVISNRDHLTTASDTIYSLQKIYKETQDTDRIRQLKEIYLSQKKPLKTSSGIKFSGNQPLKFIFVHRLVNPAHQRLK